jgi:hypothetical protein
LYLLAVFISFSAESAFLWRLGQGLRVSYQLRAPLFWKTPFFDERKKKKKIKEKNRAQKVVL